MTGDAGVGKTKALHKYIEDHPHDSVMITINPCTKSTKAVLKLLALNLGVPVTQSRDDLWMSIAAKLHDGMVVAVDEAQLLTYGSIETLRSFADFFAERRQTLGVVLVGNQGNTGENRGQVPGAVPSGREPRMAAAADKHRGRSARGHQNAVPGA